jgi:hypothetical protein
MIKIISKKDQRSPGPSLGILCQDRAFVMDVLGEFCYKGASSLGNLSQRPEGTMSPTPERQARVEIDRMLAEAGWLVQDLRQVNLLAGRGVALREFQLLPWHGAADYLLYLDGKAAGVVEAKLPFAQGMC